MRRKLVLIVIFVMILSSCSKISTQDHLEEREETTSTDLEQANDKQDNTSDASEDTQDTVMDEENDSISDLEDDLGNSETTIDDGHEEVFIEDNTEEMSISEDLFAGLEYESVTWVSKSEDNNLYVIVTGRSEQQMLCFYSDGERYLIEIMLEKSGDTYTFENRDHDVSVLVSDGALIFSAASNRYHDEIVYQSLHKDAVSFEFETREYESTYNFLDLDALEAEYEVASAFAETFYDSDQSYDGLSDEELDMLYFAEAWEWSPPWTTWEMGCSWYCGGQSWYVDSSSMLDEDTYHGYRVHDGNIMTAWVEGAEDDGIGEWIQINFGPNTPRVSTISIYNGYQKSESTYFNNNRVKAIRLFVNDYEYGVFPVADTTTPQTIEIIPTTSLCRDLILTFEIVDIYKGDVYQDTCISELDFTGWDVHCISGDSYIQISAQESVQADTLEVGDMILGYNLATQSTEWIPIKGIYSVTHDRTISYDFGLTSLVTSYDHPLIGNDFSVASYDPEASEHYEVLHNVRETRIGDCYVGYIEGHVALVELMDIEVRSGNVESYVIEIEAGYGYWANNILCIGY